MPFARNPHGGIHTYKYIGAPHHRMGISAGRANGFISLQDTYIIRLPRLRAREHEYVRCQHTGEIRRDEYDLGDRSRDLEGERHFKLRSRLGNYLRRKNILYTVCSDFEVFSKYHSTPHLSVSLLSLHHPSPSTLIPPSALLHPPLSPRQPHRLANPLNQNRHIRPHMHHIEPLLNPPPSLVPRGREDPGLLAVRVGDVQDSLDGVGQGGVFGAVGEGVAEAVGEVEGADEEDVWWLVGCEEWGGKKACRKRGRRLTRAGKHSRIGKIGGDKGSWNGIEWDRG